MRFSTILLAGALVTLVGCDSTPLAVGPSDQTAAAVVVPQSQGVAPVVVGTKQTSTGQLIPDGWCNQAGGIARFSAPGSGVASHIGRFDLEQTQCTDLTSFAVTSGEATMVAADGDEIYMTYEGQAVDSDPLTLALDYVAVGGTGRYANAEGEIHVRVVFTSDTTWTSTGTGWLQYAASDKSNP